MRPDVRADQPAQDRLAEIRDELDQPVTAERVQAVLDHFQFRSDTEAWEVGLVVCALRSALQAAEQRADALDVALAEIRERAVRTHTAEGFVGGRARRGTVCSLCSWARIFWDDDPLVHEPTCPLATDPATRGAAIMEAGRAMAKAALRVVQGRGTLQRYEYLGEAMEAWDRAIGGPEGQE